MDTAIFLGHLRIWVELMEEGSFAMATRSALDAGVTAHHLAKDLNLANERFGLSSWRGKPTQELLDGLTGFLSDLATACEAERCRAVEGHRRPDRSAPDSVNGTDESA